jgi:hypothetical protein
MAATAAKVPVKAQLLFRAVLPVTTVRTQRNQPSVWLISPSGLEMDGVIPENTTLRSATTTAATAARRIVFPMFTLAV